MRALELVLWMSALGASSFVLGVVVYTLASFALMRSHTAARPLGTWIRELVREVVHTIVTQPLLPLFYLYGYRMRSRPGPLSKVPVVFVHGYFHNRVGFVGLARALAVRGLGPLYGFNYPWWASVESNARRLERFVARVCKETGGGAVDLVCHSMGGLVAMEMLRNGLERDHVAVRRCVTIASPHAGVAWRGPILGVGGASLRRGSKLLEAHAGHRMTVPTLSLFSTHDNVVHPKETSRLAERGGLDVEVEGAAHLSILFSRAVADQVAAFLLEANPS